MKMSTEYPCIYFEKDGMCRKFSDDTVTSYCVMGPCPEQKISNADRIRAMSDEELAEWLAYPVCAYAGCEKNCPAIQGNEGMNCNANVLEWLQQPVKEE